MRYCDKFCAQYACSTVQGHCVTRTRCTVTRSVRQPRVETSKRTEPLHAPYERVYVALCIHFTRWMRRTRVPKLDTQRILPITDDAFVKYQPAAWLPAPAYGGRHGQRYFLKEKDKNILSFTVWFTDRHVHRFVRPIGKDRLIRFTIIDKLKIGMTYKGVRVARLPAEMWIYKNHVPPQNEFLITPSVFGMLMHTLGKVTQKVV